MIYDVCNIFKPLSDRNGNFLLFSQYTNDLAKSSVDPGYKVRPSRFFCLELNSNSIYNLRNSTSESDPNRIAPSYLQNHFENNLSYMRTFKNNNYTPLMSSADFFVRLIQILLGESWDNRGEESVKDDLSQYIIYDNKIDLESWTDGFADVIVNIPSNSSRKLYDLNLELDEPSIESLITELGKDEFDNIGYILGWKSTDNLPIPGNTGNSKIICCDGSNLSSITGFLPQGSLFDLLLPSTVSESDSFTFNTILLCYDIIDEHNNPIYTDIPMGLYFTGDWDSSNDTFRNPVTIRKSVDSALGVGSSWSLRISTKFAPTPQGQLKVEDVAVESGAVVSSLSAIMSANAELIKTVNNMSKKTWVDTQSYRDLLATFKNGRTNVPYIKSINGINYWFVNGRNTEVRAY